MPVFYIAGSLIVAATLLTFTKYKTGSGTNSENQKVIKEVSAIIDVPDETPTVIAVTDLEKINKYQFFNNADIGDVVLIYPKNKKAILYRPSRSKIIEVGKVQEEGAVAGEKTTAISPSPLPSATISEETFTATASPVISN